MVAGLLALCALFCASPAQAAFTRAPIELGPGDGNSPSAVVDPAGTAHIAWGIAEDLIGYCALPRGARSCARTTTLSLDARDGRPVILRRPQDGALIVVASRDDIDADPDESTWVFTSLDGVNWSGPVPIGLGIADLDAAVLTADGQAVDLLAADDTNTNRFQRAPLAGPPATLVLNLATAPDGTTTDYIYPGDMVRLRSGRTLAFLGSPADGFVYRILTGADPFADAAWQPWPGKRVSKESDDPRPAAGPRGAFVMYEGHILDQVYGAAPEVVRRLYGGNRWGRPRGLFYEVTANTTSADLAQDAKGRLYAVVLGYSDSGRRSCIAYARSASRKRWFSHAVSVHQTLKDAEKPGRLRLAVAPTGGGVVAWSTTGTPAAARVQWLKPGRGITRPRPHARRGCPPFPR
jgi:hypothetical protein